MQGRDDLPGFIAAFTGSHRFILDYLTDEVLERRPKGTKNFLLQTSILDRLCGPLCDALTGGSNGQATLERLEQANLFIVPLDDERRWYRYHHLFAEVLRQRLQQTHLSSIAEFHCQASMWFEDNGLLSEAVEHALLGQDGVRAAQLVELHGESMRMRGELVTLLKWLEALPEETIRARPKLGLNYAFLLVVTNSFIAAEQRLLEVEQALQVQPVGDEAGHATLWGQAAAIRSIVSFMLGYSGEVILTAARQALDQLPDGNVPWRGHLMLILGATYYYLKGDVAAADRTLAEAIRLGEEMGDVFTIMLALRHQSSIYLTQGRLLQAEATCERLLRRAVEPGWRGQPAVGYARLARSWLHYERNELAAAMEDVIEGWQRVKGYTLKRISLDGYVMLARLKQLQGNETEAGDLMQQAVQLVQNNNLKQTFVPVAAWQARLWLAQGHHKAVAQWAQEIEPTISADLNPALEFEHLTLARIQIAQNQLNEAQQLLARLLSAAEAAGRMGRVIEICVLQALVASAQGNIEQVLPLLERALTLAEPEGYIRTFVDEGEPMAELLRQAQSQGISPDYVNKLLAAFRDFRFEVSNFGLNLVEQSPISNLQSAKGAQSEIQNLIEPLTERELELLALVTDGHSNQEIAQELFLAVGTVKKHLNNIFGKLDVSSRTQAVARARELNLL
jgi:LuxR family maltose regulon positive regulatory protein